MEQINRYHAQEETDFAEKIYVADDSIKNAYNIIKNHIMQYEDVKNRLSRLYDSFRVKKENFIKISYVGRKLRLYLDLNPDSYPMGEYPHVDVSKFERHVNTPFMMRVSSTLSIRRAKILINDVMLKYQLHIDENYETVDYIEEYKNYNRKELVNAK